MERAVPLTLRIAASTSKQFRSGILIFAISSTCAAVILPTFVLCGSARPLRNGDGALDQHRNRRSLRDEGKRTVRESRDDYRDDQAFLILAQCVTVWRRNIRFPKPKMSRNKAN